MTTPLKKIDEEKNGNYQSSLKGGEGVPPVGKRPIYFRFFLLKASLTLNGYWPAPLFPRSFHALYMLLPMFISGTFP